jgi:IS605 OrfB family transposase
MKNINTYNIRLVNCYGILDDTVKVYNSAVMFFVNLINKEWNSLSGCKNNECIKLVEALTVETKNNPFPKYGFSKKFYKFPSYLRRSAIKESYGLVSSYRSNLENWENTPKHKRGKQPKLPKQINSFPCMYRDNCFIRTGEYTAKLKAYLRNTWDWVDVKLRKTDVDYISKRCCERKECAPTLIKKHKVWELSFPFEHSSKLTDTPLKKRIIISVDLGIKNACTCSAMLSDGTVVGRHFLNLSSEYDYLNHCLNDIRRARKQGSRRTPRKWAKVRNINTDISRKTAQYITDIAIMYNADVVVMESLHVSGKKRGGNKQRLHHWRCQYVQALVTNKCHSLGIRVSHVCAVNTSRLAFDGSGEVKRGNASERTGGNYSICEFSNGKLYNCDLNASYNIGARYFIRETLREMSPATRLEVGAKVPCILKRSTCVLSDLKDLCAVLEWSTPPITELVVSGWSGSPIPLKGNREEQMVSTAVGSTQL